METKPFETYEELLILKGRVEAFIGYARNTEYSIDREVAAGMLGFKLLEVPDAEASD